MQIKVRTLTGKILLFDIELFYSVGTIKSIVQDSQGIPPEVQRFIFAGRQLEDGRTAGDYRITEGSELSLILRLRGCACGCGGVQYEVIQPVAVPATA